MQTDIATERRHMRWSICNLQVTDIVVALKIKLQYFYRNGEFIRAVAPTLRFLLLSRWLREEILKAHLP